MKELYRLFKSNQTKPMRKVLGDKEPKKPKECKDCWYTKHLKDLFENNIVGETPYPCGLCIYNPVESREEKRYKEPKKTLQKKPKKPKKLVEFRGEEEAICFDFEYFFLLKDRFSKLENRIEQIEQIEQKLEILVQPNLQLL